MLKTLSRYIMLCIALLVIVTGVKGNDEIIISHQTGEFHVNLAPSLSFFEDKSCALEIRDFFSMEKDNFSLLERESIEIKRKRNSCFWYTATILNHSGSTRELVIKGDDTYLRHINAYVFEESHLLQEYEGGIGKGFTRRVIAHRNTAFPMRIGNGEQRTVYLMVENKWDDYQLTLELMDRRIFDSVVSRENLVIGAAVGFLLLLIITAILLWLSTRQRLFGFYFFYSLCALMFFISIVGLDYQYIVYDAPRLAHNLKLITSSLGIFTMYLLVVQYFIEQKAIENWKKWHTKLVIPVFLYGFITYFFQYRIDEWNIPIIKSLYDIFPRALPVMIIAFIILYILVRQVYKNPIWTNILFLTGFAGWVLLAILSVLSNQAILSIPLEFYQMYTIGILFEAMAVTIIMASIIMQMRSEKFELDYKLKAAQLKNEQAAKIKELDAAKSRFYTNITHEFRTPLTVIKGLTDQVEGNDDKKRLIQRNSNILLRLINQLLDISKADKGELRLHPVQDDIIKYLRYLCESYRSWGSGKNIRFHYLPEESGLTMDFDPDRIQQIIGNLVSNAIKNTDSGGDIYFFVKKSIDQLKIAIKDTGSGIHPDHLANIFDRFFQENDSQYDQAGSGIGLSLVKELVQLMNGSVGVQSELGEGSEFTIWLPITNEAPVKNIIPSIQEEALDLSLIDPPSNVVQASGHGENINGEKDSILIVEDNPDVMHYIKKCLEETFDIHQAENGFTGAKMALEIIPDLIISDVMMPEKNGLELCEELKMNILSSHIPIILLTAKVDQKAKVRGLIRGADAYLAKPFDKEELLVRISSLIEQRKRIQKHFLADSNMVKGRAHQKENAFLSRIRSIIIAELTNPEFDVQRLSRTMAMSRSQVYRKVKALTGRSIANYIRYIRLQEGKKLLESTGKTISEIAYDVGFNDLPYFSNSFSEEFGYPPNATRN